MSDLKSESRPYGLWLQEDRDFFTSAFTKIAERLVEMRIIPRTERGARFTVETQGCVYKFYVRAYAKRGTPIYEEQKRERVELLAEFLETE